jgi:anti-sigma factor RsiW
MDITRNVILDLLPLYVAGEVSADTCALVEKYLKTDPELANVAKQLEVMEKPRDIPVPLSQDDKMRAYRQARRQRLLITIIIAGAMSIFLALTLFIFFSSP